MRERSKRKERLSAPDVPRSLSHPLGGGGQGPHFRGEWKCASLTLRVALSSAQVEFFLV